MRLTAEIIRRATKLITAANNKNAPQISNVERNFVSAVLVKFPNPPELRYKLESGTADRLNNGAPSGSGEGGPNLANSSLDLCVRVIESSLDSGEVLT